MFGVVHRVVKNTMHITCGSLTSN
uniref:Uncharacterized protein n=1 Tax=Anguilla anguilla TaxID=7936 RepID=A0A0E9U872_ANGAN